MVMPFALTCMARPSSDRSGILRLGDVLEPGHGLAVERFLHGDVHHAGVGAGTVPVLLARRNPHRVAGADFAHRPALGLNPPGAEHDVQGLPERMGVPSGARTWLEAHAVASDPRRRRRGSDAT